MQTVDAGDASIPALGVGTAWLEDEECRRAVEAALDLGYRHVDTAEYYDNEAAVGAAIDAASVDRDDLFVTTKVWRTHLRRADAREAALASLDRLGLEYVDLLLIHWPHPRVPVSEPLSALESLRDEGRVRHVGVSNFTRDQLAEARDVADAPVVTDQVRYHPYKNQDALHEYCVDAGVALTAYSPLAQGAVLDDEVLARIGDRYDKSPAQVALRWLLQQEGVVAIPRSSSRDHLAENLAVFDFDLSTDEMAAIDDLTGGLRVRIGNLLPKLMRKYPL